MIIQIVAIIAIVAIGIGIFVHDKMHGDYDIPTYDAWKKEHHVKDI